MSNTYSIINDPIKLSPRQMQILKLLAKGHSYKAISAHLHLTLGTIKQHVHLLLKKTECSSKTAAINRLDRGELFSKKR